jgi:hypothetical protein
LLLYAKTINNICYITTANLDGETNIKSRKVPGCIPNHIVSAEELDSFNAVIQCDKPNTRLYEFKGKIIIDEKE